MRRCSSLDPKCVGRTCGDPGTSRRPLPFAALFLALLTLWPAAPAAAQSDRTRNVLVLFSYERALPVNTLLDQSIRSVLRPGPASRIEVFSEDFDFARFPAKQYERDLHDVLHRKYRSRPIDLIITTFSPALDFVLRHRAGLFPGVPIVFCTVEEQELTHYTLGPSVTGVAIQGGVIRETLAIALGLHPGAREVIYIGGTTAYERSWEAQVREAVLAYAGRVTFRSLSHLPMDQILKKVAHLPPSSLVFYYALSRDASGNYFIPRDALALIAQASSAPIYGIAETFLGHGMVGGHVVDYKAQGTKAAVLSLRILGGERVADIPVVRNLPNVPAFDWHQLRRWGISEDRLPPGSVIRFRELSVWELYKWYILGAVSLLALQSLLIGTLLVERRHRKNVQRSLDERLRFQTLISGLSAAFINLPAFRVDEEIERGLVRIVEFLGVDRAALAQFAMDTGGFLITHSASREEVERAPAVIMTAELPWVADRLLRGEVVRFSRLADLSAEASVDRESYLRRGIKSQVLIPLTEGMTPLGALVCTTLRAERAWPEELMPHLLLVGGIFANALVRQRGQEALRQSEDRFRLLSETTHAVPWEADAKTGQFTYVGPQAERVFGYPIADWYTKDFWPAHIHPEDRQFAVELCLKSAQIRKDYEFEYRLLTADGGTLWVHDIVSVEYADGEPRTLRGFMIDVTVRKHTEEALHDSEGRYQTLAELSPVGIFHTDSHGDCLFVNERWCEIAGLTLEQSRGSGWIQAVHPEDRERVRREWYDAAKMNQAFRSEYRFRRPDGQTSWVVGQAQAEMENGTVKGYVGTITCITDRKQAEEAVRDLSGRLISAQEEERRRLARELHDDLTQRLAVLAIEAGKLEQQLESSEPLVVSRMRQIKDRVVKLSADVHGISHQLHPSILDDLGLVNAVEAECASFTDREGIQVRCRARDVPGTPPQDVALGLYRITQEGLRNIAKHAQTKKAVVNLTGTDGEILLLIRDYGIGFDSVGVRGKAGLGLASMEERVRLMRGHLTIKSQPGQGTTILVRVPLVGGHA